MNRAVDGGDALGALARRTQRAAGRSRWYPSSDIPKILIGSAMGDPKASELGQVVRTIIEQIVDPSLGKHKPALCMTCDTEFTANSRPPESFLILTAANPDARQRIVSVQCQACCQHPDSEQRILERVRHYLIPDARVVHLSEAGHA